MTQHLKRGTFHVLHWLFEGDTLTPAVGVLLYLLVWFLPVLKPSVDSGIDANVWHALGWMPNGISAAIFIPLAIYQVVCCRLLICHWWSRIVTSVLVAAFVTYTTVAPAYVLWVKTSAFPEYYAGSAMVIFACVVLVARNLRRDDDGGRPAYSVIEQSTIWRGNRSRRDSRDSLPASQRLHDIESRRGDHGCHDHQP